MKYGFLRLVYGALLVWVLFVPFAVFHTMTEPHLSGVLLGFMLPVGYVATASGAVIILYPRSIWLRRIGLGCLLILSGVSMLLSILLFPRELSIHLFYGAKMIDMDFSTFNGAILLLSLFSMVAGVAFGMPKMHWKGEIQTIPLGSDLAVSS